MLTVLNCRTFKGKKDPTKTFICGDLMNDEDGLIAVDVFLPAVWPVGSKVDVKPAIVNHKLACNVVLVAEKK